MAQVAQRDFEVSSPNWMKPWEAWLQSWPCCGQEVGSEIVWGPFQPLILCFPHSHSHGVISNILHYTQIPLVLWCYRHTTDRVPKSLLFYQFKSYPLLNKFLYTLQCFPRNKFSFRIEQNHSLSHLSPPLPPKASTMKFDHKQVVLWCYNSRTRVYKSHANISTTHKNLKYK